MKIKSAMEMQAALGSQGYHTMSLPYTSQSTAAGAANEMSLGAAMTTTNSMMNMSKGNNADGSVNAMEQQQQLQLPSQEQSNVVSV